MSAVDIQHKLTPQQFTCLNLIQASFGCDSRKFHDGHVVFLDGSNVVAKLSIDDLASETFREAANRYFIGFSEKYCDRIKPCDGCANCLPPVQANGFRWL